MSDWIQVTYAYDGSFTGFLSCVWESFARKEYPCHFLTPTEEQFSLYPVQFIESDEKKAKKIYAALRNRLSLESQQLVEHSFLTCLPQKEQHIYTFLHDSIQQGLIQDLTDSRLLILSNAVRHLLGEVHLLKGFVRFSDYNTLLVGEISPKNRVLPLLREHFCARFPNEAFLLFDKNHKEALCYAEGLWKIIPLDELTLDAPDEIEEHYRTLWRKFYNTIAIESRYNPKLRMSHMPKRYWENMTELG